MLRISHFRYSFQRKCQDRINTNTMNKWPSGNPFLPIYVNDVMIRFVHLVVLVLLAESQLSGQAKHLNLLRDEIAFYADITATADLDQHRIRAHDQMVACIDTFLMDKGSYEMSLDSIPWLSVLHGDDFRIVTWQLRRSDDEYKYSGFIQWPDRLVRLKDTRPFINGAAYTTFTPSGWYGCLYYRILPFEKGKEKYYVLLGYNAENSLLNIKVADVLDLSGPEPRLGLPVFVGQGEPRSRLMITYADVSPARLNYDDQLEGIVHDHLESMPIGPEGESLPVADGSMEAWILKKGDWIYQEEVYDVKLTEPPMTDERRNWKEDKDILGRPRKE